MSGYQTNHAGAAYGHGSSRLTAASANNSSVLRSINDILREGDRGMDYVSGAGHRSRSGSNSSTGAHHLYADYGSNASPTRRGIGGMSSHGATGYGSHSRGASPSRPLNHHHYGPGGGGGIPTEEERSMERLASTFRTEDYTSSLYERLHDFSPLASDQDMGGHHHHMMVNSDGYGGGGHGHHGLHHQQQQQHHHQGGQMAPTAMPLLPDMPSRSRKLLEDLAHANAMGTATDVPTMHIQSRGKYGVGSAAAGGTAGAHQHTSHTSRYLSPR